MHGKCLALLSSLLAAEALCFLLQFRRDAGREQRRGFLSSRLVLGAPGKIGRDVYDIYTGVTVPDELEVGGVKIEGVRFFDFCFFYENNVLKVIRVNANNSRLPPLTNPKGQRFLQGLRL